MKGPSPRTAPGTEDSANRRRACPARTMERQKLNPRRGPQGDDHDGSVSRDRSGPPCPAHVFHQGQRHRQPQQRPVVVFRSAPCSPCRSLVSCVGWIVWTLLRRVSGRTGRRGFWLRGGGPL